MFNSEGVQKLISGGRAAFADGGLARSATLVMSTLDAIYNELATLLDADQGPDADSLLEPDTVELYERHRRLRRRHAG